MKKTHTSLIPAIHLLKELQNGIIDNTRGEEDTCKSIEGMKRQ